MKKNLNLWISKLYKFQREIMLVYRPTLKHPWSDRCLYLEDGYCPTKPYNHRSVLMQEVVIEFDTDDLIYNKACANIVVQRLHKDGIKCAKWFSGNKSTHVHCLLDTKGATNLPLLKKIFMRHYCEGLPLPDLQLASSNHLIRAELGVHEKTGNLKVLLGCDRDYPCLSTISNTVWQKYVNDQRQEMTKTYITNVEGLADLPGFKYIVTAHEFRESEDGRERALFMLIHVLKSKYENRQADFSKFLCEWYRYSGGYKLTDRDIGNKVQYHWKKTYRITEKYLNELLESIGKKDLIQSPKSL